MRYEKGRKDASRQRILDVATKRFRRNGIAASGLAGIMSEAGLTNGAFYPHFHSKTELVRECMVTAMESQSKQVQELMGEGGLEALIAAYLSPEHRDHPEKGCPSAALLPEIARESLETRSLYEEHLIAAVQQISSALFPQRQNSEEKVLGILATLVGALQMARAVKGTALSDRILEAGAEAARLLVKTHSSTM
jgi:TetR/AcrR family transcriptional regulator, transcriptional repressor for nem operon